MGPPTKKQVLEREAVRDPKMQKISSMFPVIPKPTPAATIGRPKKVQRSGRPPSKSKETTTTSSSSSSSTPPKPPESDNNPPVVNKRVNYTAGDAKLKIEAAMSEWNNDPKPMSASGKPLSQNQFAISREIPPATFSEHLKRKKLREQNSSLQSSKLGRPALIPDETMVFIKDYLIRMDRGNRALSRKESILFVQELCPRLTYKQCKRAFDQTVRSRFKGILSKVIRAQKTTMKRNAITIPQQYRWHKCIDEAYNRLDTLNQGVDSKGKSFEEVKAKYIWGGDETCLLASDGKARIIGEHSRKKHEKTIDTGRTSITMYRTGNAAGDNGPTAFLPPGKKRDAAFTDKYLEEFGAAKGSTVVMTKTGFMTEEAWTKITPSQIEGIRAVSDNEDWWAIMIVDGFVAHCISPEVMQLYYDNKIIIIKEEADSSHVNQSYDQLVALSDKSHLREALDIVQSGDVFKNTVMTGWDLIVVGLHAVRQCKMDTWISSFKKVNLHPDYRIGFGDWCQKIEAFLQPGQSFKLQNMTDIYALLPSFWHGMLPAEKRHAVDIVQKHKASTGMWSMECVTELVEQCHIPQQDLQNFRVCFDAAVDDPSHLDKGLPGPAELAVLGAEEDEASAAMKSATAGLVSFQLIPKNEKGEAVFKDNLQLFNHMLQWTRRTSMSKAHIPSSYLAVEISKFQEKDILNANCDDYLMAKFMRDAHCGDRSSLYSAKRKLDCLGYIQSSSGIQNDPERIKRLKDRLMLADSMERIVNVKRNLKKQKADEANAKISSLAPAALLKLREKAYNFGVLTVSELHSVSRSYFNVELKKGRKDSLLHEIQSLYEANPDLLANVASIQVQNQNHVGVGDEEDDSDDDNDNGTSDEDDDDENGEESDSEEEEEEEESNIYRKTFNHTSKRAKLFSDSDLKVGDRIELAWPNRSIFAGKVIGLQDHSSILDTIHDSDSMFPHDMHCARTIRFDDDDVLHLSLPRQREVSAGDCIDFGYWRRIKN